MQLLEYEKLKKQTIAQNLKPMPYILAYLFDKMQGDAKTRFDAKEHPI